jgi:hypothetical protein
MKVEGNGVGTELLILASHGEGRKREGASIFYDS